MLNYCGMRQVGEKDSEQKSELTLCNQVGLKLEEHEAVPHTHMLCFT